MDGPSCRILFDDPFSTRIHDAHLVGIAGPGTCDSDPEWFQHPGNSEEHTPVVTRNSISWQTKSCAMYVYTLVLGCVQYTTMIDREEMRVAIKGELVSNTDDVITT